MSARGPARRTAALAPLLAVLCALGCEAPAPLTQLIVVVDTDLAVPTEITDVELVVVGPDATTQRVAGPLAGERAIDLPATLGVLHRGGPLGPVYIVAQARLGDAVTLERRARVHMIRGQTRVLELHLERICVGVRCDDESETCEHGECRPVLVSATELLPGDHIPRLDFDGGAGRCSAELCNGVDDDCDARVDEDYALDEDPRNCGTCGNVCPSYAGSFPACVSGECTIACGEGRGDCDGEPRNGCETPLDSLTMCGECGRECSAAHATPTCFGGACSVYLCAPGWGDCDELLENGCEQRLDELAHCGGCGASCAPPHAIPSCAAGVCGIAGCEPGWADCDESAANGCERRVDTLSSCGRCDVACATPEHGTAACIAGNCRIGSCEAGWADCNGVVADGCETPLDTLTDCGACGEACALPHASETCSAGACTIVECDAGWADCDGLAPTGCEAHLETAARCGACDVACSDPTPLCSVGADGARVCAAVCAGGETLCGAECASLATSLDHCGGCGRACAPPNASPVCSAGVCGIAECDPGWGDCNGSVADGCETRLDTLTDCGGCGVACDLAGASAQCTGGRCTISACEPGLADCDGSASNGCETPTTTLADCGGCGVPCALPHASESCATGACALLECEAGWGDCNGMSLDGCETPLDSITHCGTCGASCDLPRASSACAAGGCAIEACDPEWGDCDHLAFNGCEQSLRTTADCGACGVTCPPVPNASVICAEGTCAFTCDALFGDCNAGSPGCETPLDTVANCGGCGVSCVVGPNATPTCAGGVCAIGSCMGRDRADCNGRIEDGCETRTDSSTQHCGACGNACARGEECRDGRCRD